MTIKPNLAELDTAYKAYLRQNGSVVVRLVKALHGCIQSAAQRYAYLRAVLERLGSSCLIPATSVVSTGASPVTR